MTTGGRDAAASSGPPIVVDAQGWARATALPLEIVPSPNCDARAIGCSPTLIVMHNISLPPGVFGGRDIDALFTNTLALDAHPYFAQLAGLRVSSHFLVRRDGSLVQFVSCDARAWHAGVSVFDGRERCNDFSIGIEVEGDDTSDFDDAQYPTLRALVDALIARYAITAAAGHSEIAPGRKTDPGPHFDWSRALPAGASTLHASGTKAP